MVAGSRNEGLAQGQKYLALGLKFAGGIVIFILGGLWLDRRLGTTPLFILVGMLVGGGLSFLSIYRQLSADEAAERKAKGKPR